MRNHALDFIAIPGACLRTAELAEYCAFVGLVDQADKRALHDALTTHLKAQLVERLFWSSTGPFKARCYVGVYWNLDHGFPDFEQFWTQSTETKRFTPRIGDATP